MAWVSPKPPDNFFTFWVAPATLIFKNTWNFDAELGDPLGLEISGITRTDPRPPKNAAFIEEKTEWTWTIDLQQGEIAFSSCGFSQYIRRKPIHTSLQQIALLDRGGISFDRPIQE